MAEVPAAPGFIQAFDRADAAVQTDGAVGFSSFIADSTKEAFAAAIRPLSPHNRACLDVA